MSDKNLNNNENSENSSNNKIETNENNNEVIVQNSGYLYFLSSFINCNYFSMNKLLDKILIFFSFSSGGIGLISFFIIDKVTAVGYFLSCIFSIYSLSLVKKMRLQASMQQSVSVLKEENNELKENNEELQENIDSLEVNITSLKTIQDELNTDLSTLKNTIGIFGNNSKEIIDNLQIIYNKLQEENKIQSKLNKNSIYLHILYIIRHFDDNSDFVLNLKELDKVKSILLNAFPNLDYEELKSKIIENKVTASLIAESIKI